MSSTLDSKGPAMHAAKMSGPSQIDQRSNFSPHPGIQCPGPSPAPVSRMRQIASLSMTAAEDRMFVPILGVLVSLACQVCILGGDEQNARTWAELMFE